jgi:MFS family permease
LLFGIVAGFVGAAAFGIGWALVSRLDGRMASAQDVAAWAGLVTMAGSVIALPVGAVTGALLGALLAKVAHFKRPVPAVAVGIAFTGVVAVGVLAFSFLQAPSNLPFLLPMGFIYVALGGIAAHIFAHRYSLDSRRDSRPLPLR